MADSGRTLHCTGTKPVAPLRVTVCSSASRYLVDGDRQLSNDAAGSPIEPTGSPTDPAGNPADPAGNPADPAGSPTDPTGSPADQHRH